MSLSGIIDWSEIRHVGGWAFLAFLLGVACTYAWMKITGRPPKTEAQEVAEAVAIVEAERAAPTAPVAKGEAMEPPASPGSFPTAPRP